jgi:hypothetical protein
MGADHGTQFYGFHDQLPFRLKTPEALGAQQPLLF